MSFINISGAEKSIIISDNMHFYLDTQEPENSLESAALERAKHVLTFVGNKVSYHDYGVDFWTKDDAFWFLIGERGVLSFYSSEDEIAHDLLDGYVIHFYSENGEMPCTIAKECAAESLEFDEYLSYFKDWETVLTEVNSFIFMYLKQARNYAKMEVERYEILTQ